MQRSTRGRHAAVGDLPMVCLEVFDRQVNAAVAYGPFRLGDVKRRRRSPMKDRLRQGRTPKPTVPEAKAPIGSAWTPTVPAAADVGYNDEDDEAPRDVGEDDTESEESEEEESCPEGDSPEEPSPHPKPKPEPEAKVVPQPPR